MYLSAATQVTRATEVPELRKYKLGGGGLGVSEVDEELRVEAVGDHDLVDDALALLVAPGDGVELVAVVLLELLRLGNLVEEVEADTVGLEAELALHERANDLTA